MIDWSMVDAGVLLSALRDAVLVAGLIWLVVVVRRGKRQVENERMRDAIARYESRKCARGSLSALYDRKVAD